MRLSVYHSDKFKYYPYQIEAVHSFFIKRKNGEPSRLLIGLPTGMGKTAISESIACYLLEKQKISKAIFVTKKSSVIQTSNPEKDLFKGFTRTCIYENAKPERTRIYNDFKKDPNQKMLVTSWDFFRIDSDIMIREFCGPDVLWIFDEATEFKNPTSKKWKLVNKISNLTEWMIALTATPVMKNLNDLHYILLGIGVRVMSDHHFFSKHVRFQQLKIKVKFGKTKIVNKQVGYKSIDKFYNTISNFYFTRSKSEVTDIPPFSVHKHSIKEDESVKRALQLIYGKNGSMTPYGLACIANSTPGVILEDPNMIGPKEKDIIALIQGDLQDEQALIYSPFRTSIIHFQNILEKEYDIRTSAIHGQTKDREQEKQRFIRGESKIILCTSAAEMAVDGLQVCNNLVFLTQPITVGPFIQMAGRISRVNTKHKDLHLFFPMLDDSIDHDIYLIIQNQLRLVQKVSPESIDEGLLDYSVTSTVIAKNEAAENWVQMSLKRRYAKYIKDVQL